MGISGDTASPQRNQHVTEIVDAKNSRLRRIDDLARAGLYLATIILVVLLAIYAHTTTQAVAQDLTKVFINTTLAQILLLPLSMLQNLFILLSPVSLLIMLALRGQWLRTFQAAFTAIVGGVVAFGASVLFSALPYVFSNALKVWAVGGSIVAISIPFTAVVAMMTMAGERRRDQLVRLLWAITWAILALAVLQGRMTLPSALITVLLGTFTGCIGRYLWGVRNYRPTGTALIRALTRVGIIPRRILRLDPPTEGDLLCVEQVTFTTEADSLLPVGKMKSASLPLDPVSELATFAGQDLKSQGETAGLSDRVYCVISENSRRYRVVATDGDSRLSTWITGIWNNLRLRSFSKSTAATVRQNGEYTALMGAMTTRTQVNTRPYHGLAHSGTTMLNIFEDDIALRPFSSLDSADILDEQLISAWKQLLHAHQGGLAHRNINAQNLCLGSDGSPYFLNWSQGEVAASKMSILIDQVQLLVLTSLVVGEDQAVKAMGQVLPASQIEAMVPVLQTLALPDSTRRQVRKTSLLPNLRQRLLSISQTDPATIPRAQLRSFSWSSLIFTALGVAAVLVILGSLNFKEIYATIITANGWWIGGGIFFAIVMSCGQALSLQAVTPNPLGYLELFLLQMAGSVTSLVVPAGLGVGALNLRYLTKKNMTSALALATVSLMQLFQFVITVALLAVMVMFTGTSMNVRLPSSTMVAAVLVIVAALVTAFALPKVRKWIWGKIEPSFYQVWPRLIWITSSPRRMFLTALGCLLQTGLQLSAFYCAVAAFGYHLPIATITVTFLVSNTLGSLIPTPGGLGPVEAALTAGLQVAGVPGAIALSGALLYRLLTFWMRAPLGWLAMRYLQRHDVL
ncbi:lysylphosphatidylglycerol synthase transmembrane domain-containing protein [Varibaculum vaginae]|uniref:lysylphosphatidylglycerol synthase transmembrane domain-containing protein n=1 Tax=Varibaculum vaginae TaxID=2364797 RepID=UPI000F0899D6|nr:lysylphosphatidylglycerol synthase transmembrane domain-containing protein [Varibaculum vaginae]